MCSKLGEEYIVRSQTDSLAPAISVKTTRQEDLKDIKSTHSIATVQYQLSLDQEKEESPDKLGRSVEISHYLHTLVPDQQAPLPENKLATLKLWARLIVDDEASEKTYRENFDNEPDDVQTFLQDWTSQDHRSDMQKQVRYTHW